MFMNYFRFSNLTKRLHIYRKPALFFLFFIGQFANAGIVQDFIYDIKDFLEYVVSSEENRIETTWLNKLNRKINHTNKISTQKLIEILAKRADRPQDNIDHAINVAAHSNWGGLISYLVQYRTKFLQDHEQVEDALLACCYYGNDEGAAALLNNITLQANAQTVNGKKPIDYARQKQLKKTLILFERTQQNATQDSAA